MSPEAMLIASAEKLEAEAMALMPALDSDAFQRVMAAHMKMSKALDGLTDERLAQLRMRVALLQAKRGPQ